MNKKKDALGVTHALALKSANYDLLCALYIKSVCVAVINRYDQSLEAAEMTVLATDILNEISKSNMFTFRLSHVKKICEYLLKHLEI